MIAARSLLVDEQGAQSEPGSGPDKPSWPWPRAEQLKTRVAHAYCSRNLAAEACSYADICEQCDNFTTSVEFVPALQAQLADVTALREHAQARGWDTGAWGVLPLWAARCASSTQSGSATPGVPSCYAAKLLGPDFTHHLRAGVTTRDNSR